MLDESIADDNDEVILPYQMAKVICRGIVRLLFHAFENNGLGERVQRSESYGSLTDDARAHMISCDVEQRRADIRPLLVDIEPCLVVRVDGVVALKADGHPAATVCADHDVPSRFQTEFDHTARLDVETLILLREFRVSVFEDARGASMCSHSVGVKREKPIS